LVDNCFEDLAQWRRLAFSNWHQTHVCMRRTDPEYPEFKRFCGL
jgi:hypothetical protein